jgi:DNA-directed RNA polymerase specialized sigma24 family protein
MADKPGRFYTLPPQVRDEMIVQLRGRGLTYAAIARRVGMDESGVRRALQRIRDGGFGQGQAPR